MARRSRVDERSGARPRAAAAKLVARILTAKVTAESALASAGAEPGRDDALVRALTYGALRWHHRLQWQVRELLAKPLGSDEAELAALLRIGLLQLQTMRIPAHAAVSATVEAARLVGRARAGGLVNAVLRRFLRERATLLARGDADEEVRYSHPQWLIDALRAERGEGVRAILEANNAAPPMWLRPNVRVTSVERYLERLQAHDIAASVSEHVPSAVLLGEPRPTHTLPGYDEGEVSVQDAAAQLAAGALALAPGIRVLDACAAPGGKTAHVLESCPGVEVVAVDRDGGRLERVRANLERLKLSAALWRADALLPKTWWDGRPFERILLDAPCSAVGVIRRHPDIKVLRSPEDVDRAVELQARLLDALWPLLAPGGRLVYATCSVLERENADQIARFTKAAPDAVLSGPGPGTALEILPGEANMDGFYYACLDKEAQQ